MKTKYYSASKHTYSYHINFCKRFLNSKIELFQFAQSKRTNR